jgi:hypothetical protein
MEKNMRRIFIGLLIAAALMAGGAQAGDLAGVLADTTGVWEGELYYLDYQSGQRFGIPVRIDAETTPDGATLIRKLTFTDPGNLVHAVNLVTIDRESGELVEAYFREGRGELMRYEITETDIDSAASWRVVYEHDGQDDDRPARIRHTLERSGQTMKSTKAVRFLDDEGGVFFVRNGSELKFHPTDQPNADAAGR